MIKVKVEGLENLAQKFNEAPDVFAKEVTKALGYGIAMVETESKRLTPVDKGLLKASIGGSTDGFKFVRGLTAGVGTNVKYAVFVHESFAKHKTGERKFMQKGAEGSVDYIKQVFAEALGGVVNSIVSK